MIEVYIVGQFFDYFTFLQRNTSFCQNTKWHKNRTINKNGLIVFQMYIKNK